MNPLLKFICLLAIIFISCTSFSATSTSHVLVLQSFEIQHSWSREEFEGISKAFAEQHSEHQIHFEYLDTTQTFNRPYQEELTRLLLLKYRKLRKQFVGVITTDNEALTFYLEYLAPYFPKILLVFCGILPPLPETLKQSNIPYAGVLENLDFGETVSAALRLHPQTRQIVVLADPSAKAQEQLAIFKRQLPHTSLPLQVIGDGPFNEIARQLESLRDGDLLFRLRFYNDSTGASLTFEQSMAFLRYHVHIPIYLVRALDGRYRRRKAIVGLSARRNRGGTSVRNYPRPVTSKRQNRQVG